MQTTAAQPPEAEIIPLAERRREMRALPKLERSRAEVLIATRNLVWAIESMASDVDLRRRGLTLSRNVVFWVNQLPPPAQTTWLKTKQVNWAARFVRNAIAESTATATHPERARALIVRALSENLPVAQVENRLLANLIGNQIDIRRTDRVLRELARSMPLTCEAALYGVKRSK